MRYKPGEFDLSDVDDVTFDDIVELSAEVLREGPDGPMDAIHLARWILKNLGEPPTTEELDDLGFEDIPMSPAKFRTVANAALTWADKLEKGN